MRRHIGSSFAAALVVATPLAAQDAASVDSLAGMAGQPWLRAGEAKRPVARSSDRARAGFATAEGFME